MGEMLYTYICEYEGLVLFQVFPHLSIKGHTHNFKRALPQVQKMYKAIPSVVLFQVPATMHAGCTSISNTSSNQNTSICEYKHTHHCIRKPENIKLKTQNDTISVLLHKYVLS